MSKEKLVEYVEKAHSSLKDFQKATVDAVCSEFFAHARRCMLVADEVGLGKTIVARGIIARRIKERMGAGSRGPLRVTYICSNQVIALENVRKLNLFPPTVHMKHPVSRLGLLAFDEPEKVDRGKLRQHLLELTSLTPATSFHVQRSPGIREERGIIYALLCHDLRMRRRWKGLCWLLRGGVDLMRPFRKFLKGMRQRQYRPDLPRRFIRRLKRCTLPKESSVYKHLAGAKRRTLYEAVVELAGMLAGRTEKAAHGACLELIHQLRRVLIQCCARYVKADIYILDEFQRFRELLDRDNRDEAAILARYVLRLKHSRVLLLSATPFKAFTDHNDLERGDDHYRDFRSVLGFLLDDDQDALRQYDVHREELYRQLLNCRRGNVDADPRHRDAVETILRTVICRTERRSVAENPAIMIEDLWREPIRVTPGDIENFRQTDAIVQALNQLNLRAGKPIEYCKSAIEYCKSALYPFSFLDRYQIKELLRRYRKRSPEIRSCLRQAKNAWLARSDVRRYRLVLGPDCDGKGPANARLSALIDRAIGPHGAELLWIPPSLPYYPLAGSFAGASGFSKTLVFSAWVMVPRMIASLLSYEVERRTVGNKDTREATEEEDREYFKRRRHPQPQLRFSQDQDGRPRNMSNFCLLYPSCTLTDIVDPVRNLGSGRSLEELRAETKRVLEERIASAGLAKYVQESGETDRWYWAAPLLLDRLKELSKASMDAWFGCDTEERDPWDRDTYFRGAAEQASAREAHFDHLRECYLNPDRAGLGPIPADLPDVLADLALGSPAVLMLRSLRRLFQEQSPARAMVGAFDAADEFANLFNKPESIAALRLGVGSESFAGVDLGLVERAPYWQIVARYCANGCLQAVVDEYFHVLKGQNVDAAGAISQLLDSVNLETASINVDSLDTFRNGRPMRMRCHYAVEFGSQRVETEEGGKRATNLREVFNSPFRPFVLATTSIGQEGLDFHTYCRRIVHWNLPDNPIDLEQREGRINRYKGLVIRQFVASKYRAGLGSALAGDVWDLLFKVADKEERQAKGKSELIPYWHVETNDIKIERVVPLYPFSSDQAKLSRILKTLTVYRLAFGQPRQTELVEHLLERQFSEDEMKLILKNLMIDLRPRSQDGLVAGRVASGEAAGSTQHVGDGTETDGESGVEQQ